jgi:hypothetical protein
VRGARYKKYNNYEQAYREFQAAMGDANLANEPAPVLPYDPVLHDAFPPFISPSDGHGKGGWWKKVLITSLVACDDYCNLLDELLMVSTNLCLPFLFTISFVLYENT